MFARQSTITITRSTLGDGSAFTTEFNGYLDTIRIQASEAMAATELIKFYSTKSTGLLFNVSPSSVITNYFPRYPSNATTGAANSSGVARAPICDERIMAVVTGSSTGAGATVTATVTLV